MTVGEKIRKFRTEQNLLQKDLAQKCRMSESAIRNYNLKVVEENGMYYLQAAPKKRGQASISDLIIEWGEANKKYQAGEITKEEYSHWKNTFPESIAINRQK